ncbi:phosphatase PAP2 family protein [Spirosoma taeanense]|uniref:Phosphatase PAP2 family protein n=1 Tax=Spirosoma taeanense TaxID=2735870 RepID=A0A6M5YBB3_9BACT|nr:phosphatase PAP2 family protein [Spirosoma taeanense]QJW91229.1 phosphatase PAP2 family protein [Spirosoma taeanense]
MKTYLSFLVLSLLLLLAGCKEPVIDEGIEPFTEPATTDPDGGNWRPVVLKSAADISVPQPAAVTSNAYQAELASVKNGLLGVNPEQNTAVTYWAAGGVLRWNQIARQLVAKYNAVPENDGITASSPITDPYAARIFALLSVAQYDALLVTWRAKYQYNRPSLIRQDVITRVPIADVPSYPSEDAAIAEASYQLLAYLFPDEANWLKTKATEHKQSRVWAGANVPSDLKAGEDLATAVAAKVITRAKTDGFGSALNTNWETLLAKAPYDVTWKSLEIPARPPMAPLSSQVKTWFDSAAVARSQPGLPPATTSAEFQKALTEVREIANARTREQWRIADFWADGAGTYTPLGHWNRLAEDLVRQARQNELRTARTYALMNRAMQDGVVVGWLTKYRYFVPRPSQIDPAIKTATVIPNSPGYPSSHATISAAAATVLSYVFPDEATNLNAQAAEAAISGLYGGVHYRFDTEAGTKSGTTVGQIAIDWAKTDGVK